MNSVAPYAGQFDEVTKATYPTPYAFTQKVESIRERIPGGLVYDHGLVVEYSPATPGETRVRFVTGMSGRIPRHFCVFSHQRLH